MKEGSTEALTRHAIPWQDPAYTDMDRVLDQILIICGYIRQQ